MKVSQMKQSRYLQKEDFPHAPGALCQIAGVRMENVAPENQQPENKPVLYLHGYEKGMVLNVTNAENIAYFLNNDETDNWPGHSIMVYHDPSVMMGHERKGGIRVGPAQNPNQPPTSMATPPEKAPSATGSEGFQPHPNQAGGSPPSFQNPAAQQAASGAGNTAPGDAMSAPNHPAFDDDVPM